MDTVEYHDNSMTESEDAEEEEERYGYYDEYGYNEHECKECKKCTTDAAYGYVSTIKPVIFTVVPKLMNIASVTVAVSLLHHVNVTRAISHVSRKCAKDSDKWKTLCKEVLKLPEELPIPKSIREILVKYVNVMTSRIPYWVSYHLRTVFLKEGQDRALYKLIYHIIWYPNGAINYKQTAINMLTSHRLSDVEKFKFLATYCLKEEMQRLPSSLFASIMLEYVNFSEYPLIYYWYCYFRNELNKIPVTGNVSIDCFMFRKRNVDNWSAKEYFFDRMNSDEQVQQVVQLIDQYEEVYLRPVLLKLNETQRLLVCMERPVRIATYYAKNVVNYKEFLSIWFDIRNFITVDQFVFIFRVFLSVSIPSTVLMKIYSSVSENFKNHILNHNAHEFVKIVFSSLKLIKTELIFTMLQDANDDIRKNIAMQDFYTNYCKKLLAREKFHRFNRLVNLCFSNVQESAQFTYNLVSSSENITDKCLEHYSTGNLKDIDALLTPLFPSNPRIILNYKKDLLMSPEGIDTCVDTLNSETDILNAIIVDDSFSADLASKLIKEIIFSSSASRKFKDWIMDGELNDVQNYIDRYLPSSEDKTAFKKTLITNPVRVMRNVLKVHDESYWQALILWYYEDENSVQEFKRKLKVDSMFIDLLKASVFENYDIMLKNCKFKSHITFDRLDRFLNWYFESPNEVMKYKMNKIDKFESIEMIAVLLKKREKTQLKAVMKWFFQNDAAEISKFKSKHGCKNWKICELI